MSPAMDTMRSAGKRGLVLAPVAALLLSVAALLLGNGLWYSFCFFVVALFVWQIAI